eukprot:5997-Heterococcus_DN1.PRE.1
MQQYDRTSFLCIRAKNSYSIERRLMDYVPTASLFISFSQLERVQNIGFVKQVAPQMANLYCAHYEL